MVQINKGDIERFFNFIGHQKQSELRFIEPRWKNPKPKPIQEWANNLPQFFSLCEKYNGEMNLYVGINERRPMGDKDEDVEFITAIGHDIDAHDENPDTFMVAQETALKMAESAKRNDLCEPLIVCSGRGFWVIHKVPPIENTEENRKKIKEFGRKIKEKYEREGIELDSTVYNPSRIVRIPGTLNVSSENKKILSFIVNDPKTIEDEKLKETILAIEIQNHLPSTTIPSQPNSISSFMDYCLTHEIPKGERHKVISRNMALYISDHPDRELLKEQYCKIQKGSEGELDQWLKNIDENGKEKYPFSIGQLVNFTKKYKIPFDWKSTPEYRQWKKEKKAEEKMQEVIKIEEEEDYSELQKTVLTSIALKDYPAASEEIVRSLKKDNFIYTTKDDIKSEMWIYEGGIYKPNGKSFVREFCRKILGEAYSNFIANIVISKIETDTFIEQEDFFKNNYVDEIPVLNGILNVITLQLSDFNPKKIFFNKLPVEYEKDAQCESIEKFLQDILGDEEDVIVAYELIGSGLLKEYFTEKAGMFVGGGRNGKSKLLELIKRLVGVENSCSVPLRSMREDNSSLCELHNRLFNLAGDLSATDLKETGCFKETVGRDLISAHRKFLKDLVFVNYAKHIFACNELPRVYDTTDGFWDKWVLLEFPYKFISKKEFNLLAEEDKKNKKIKDPEIIEKITTPEELSGLLNHALSGLKRLLLQKDFSQTKGTKEIKDFWIRNSDSFAAFCIDNIEEDYEGWISKKNLRKKYHRFCKIHKVKGTGDKGIKVTLEDRYGVTDGRKQEGGEFIHVWEGVKFNGNI